MNSTPVHVARHPETGGGFSLIELIAVLVIAGVLAVVAVPTLSTINATRSAAAARLIVRDLSYARERAVATGQRTWVVFNVGANTYRILQEPSGLPGRANAAAVFNVAEQKDHLQALGTGQFAGVTLSGASFDGAAEVGFDWVGKPLNISETPLAANGTVTLGGGGTATVQQGTGLITTP